MHLKARPGGEQGQVLPALLLVVVALLAGGMLLFQVGRAAAYRAEAVTGADAAALAAAGDVQAQLTEQLAAQFYYDAEAVSAEQARAAAAAWAERNGAVLTDFAYNPGTLEVQVEVASVAQLDGDAGLPTAGQPARARAQASLSPSYEPGVPLPGDVGANGSIAQTIQQVGQAMGASERVMLAAFEAALVESGMRNLPYGDRDSLGVFQQRPSVGAWGTAEQIRDPQHAAMMFFRRAIEEDRGGFSGTAGQLAQEVQVSAFPERYDQREAEARAELARVAGIGSGPPAPSAGPGPATTGATPSPTPSVAPSAKDVPAGLQPNARNLATAARQSGFDGTMLGLGDRPNKSDHPRGLAVDLMVNDGGGNDVGLGDRLAQFALSNRDRFGVTYVIWNNQIASRSQGWAWREYSHPTGGTNPTLLHKDHVHVSVAGDPAAPGAAPVPGELGGGVAGGAGGLLAPGGTPGSAPGAPSSVGFDIRLVPWSGG